MPFATLTAATCISGQSAGHRLEPGAGWLHNARVGLQPREEGQMAIRRARARAQVAARSGRKA